MSNMDRREVQAKGAALTKAISAREPTPVILGLLNDLKINVKPSEELLRATSIGKIVNKVKGQKDLDPSIPRLASEIIGSWRKKIDDQKSIASGRSSPTGTPSRANGTASPIPKAGSPNSKPSATSASPPPPGIDPSKRNWKTDGVKRDAMTQDPARNNCIGLLYDGLAFNSTETMKTILDIAVAIESEALHLPDAEARSSSTIYRDKIRSLYQNLKNKTNPALRVKVLTGEFSPRRFVSMTPEELRSPEQVQEEERIRKDNMDNAMMPQEVKSVSGTLECGKCHQKKVSYTQAQTRSAVSITFHFEWPSPAPFGAISSIKTFEHYR